MAINYGAQALSLAVETIEPYLCVTREQLDLLALWAAHTQAYPVFACTPRLSIRSQNPGEGKSTALGIVELLSREGMGSGLATGSALYSLIHAKKPTLCLDEMDNTFSPNGFSRANKPLQAILNEGYTRKGTVWVNRSGGPVELSLFTPVAFGGIGALPVAMASRAIPLMMKKGIPSEVFDPEIEGIFVSEARDVLADWLKDESRCEFLASCDRRPEIEGITDARQRQIAAPILAIGKLAGPEWEARAIAAIRYAFLGISTVHELTRFEMALRDALKVWPRDVSFMSGIELASRMAAMEDSPWKSLAGSSLAGARQLAGLLKAVGVSGGTHRIGPDKRPTQAYAREDIARVAKAL